MTSSTQPRPLHPAAALVLAAASAAMLSLSLPGYEQWWLSFVSLVPLLVLLERSTPRSAALWWWPAGYAFFFVAVLWLKHLTPVGLAALALYLSLSFLAYAAGVRLVTTGRPRLPFVLAVPVEVWSLSKCSCVMIGLGS